MPYEWSVKWIEKIKSTGRGNRNGAVYDLSIYDNHLTQSEFLSVDTCMKWTCLLSAASSSSHTYVTEIIYQSRSAQQYMMNWSLNPKAYLLSTRYIYTLSFVGISSRVPGTCDSFTEAGWRETDKVYLVHGVDLIAKLPIWVISLHQETGRCCTEKPGLSRCSQADF